MRLHRFYIPESLPQSSVLVVNYPEHLHQWKKVFRFVPGDTVIIFDGSGVECTAQFSYLDTKEARLVLQDRQIPDKEAEREIHMYVAITKKDTFEIIAQKATELGVARIIPVISARSEKKDINMLRFKKIVIEATEQSGRTVVPRIYEPIEFEKIFDGMIAPCIVWEPRGLPFVGQKDAPLSQKVLCMAIGPEGGWTPDELELFQEKGALVRSSGKTVLRTETAAIAFLSLLILTQ